MQQRAVADKLWSLVRIVCLKWNRINFIFAGVRVGCSKILKLRSIHWGSFLFRQLPPIGVPPPHIYTRFPPPPHPQPVNVSVPPPNFVRPPSKLLLRYAFQILLFDVANTLVWRRKYSCLTSQMFLFDVTNTFVWRQKYCCLTSQIVLFDATNTAVWCHKYCCLTSRFNSQCLRWIFT